MNVSANEVLARLVREREIVAGVMQDELEPLRVKAREVSAPHREKMRELADKIKRVLMEDGRQLISEELLGDYLPKRQVDAIKHEQREFFEDGEGS